MSLLTAEEKKALRPGMAVTHKCDECNRPIISSLIYSTSDGHETCSRACREAYDSKGKNSKKEKTKVAKKKVKEEEDEKKKKKGKKVEDEDENETEEDEDEEEETEDDDEENEEDDDEDEKPKKGKKAKKAAKGKKSKKDDDEDEEEDDDEDEKPKKSKKGKKDKKAKRESSVGTKTNPYQEGSFIHKVLELAKKGLDPKELKKMCKKEEVDYGWTIGVLRKHGKNGKRGVSWKLKETDDIIKVTLDK